MSELYCLGCDDPFYPDESSDRDEPICSYECQDRFRDREFLDYHGQTAFPFVVTGDESDPFDGMLCTAPDVYMTKE